jgi:hypothetical protein
MAAGAGAVDICFLVSKDPYGSPGPSFGKGPSRRFGYFPSLSLSLSFLTVALSVAPTCGQKMPPAQAPVWTAAQAAASQTLFFSRFRHFEPFRLSLGH